MKQKSILSSLLLLCAWCLAISTAHAQNSNVTVSAAATLGGAWSGGVAGPYVFTPTADNANIINTDIQNRLLGTGGFASGNVSIVTTNGAGTQPGNITVSTGVTAGTTSTTARIFALTAGGAIAVNSAINLNAAAPTSGNAAGRPGTTVNINAIGNITIAAAISANGSNAFSSGLTGSGGVGGAGGAITIASSSGSYSSSGQISSNAGNGSSQTLSFTSRNGGNAGSISITATSVSYTAALNAVGGNGAVNGAGGNGGAVTIAGPTSVNSAGAINASGGNGNLVGNGGNGGTVSIQSTAGTLAITAPVVNSAGTGVDADGANITIRGTGGIRLTANLTSARGGIGNQGNITINDGATVVTTGGGTNDGQTAGVITGNNLTKSGGGTFNIFGSNNYEGNTTISAGKLRVSSDVSATDNTAGALGNDPLGTALINLNAGGIEFNSGIFGRTITVGGNVTLDAYTTARTVTGAITGGAFTVTIGANTVASAAGQPLTLSGVISGAGFNVTKSFNSSLTLSGANTFTGTKTLNDGQLNINSAGALGTAAGTFILNGGDLGNTSAGAVTTANFPITLNSDFSFTGTQNLNLGTGAITMSANRDITVSANTLTLGGVINAPTLSLTKSGAGVLAMGATAKTLNNLVISAGTFTSTSNVLTLAGNFTNNGTYTAAAGTAVFNGTTQSISGTTATTAFSTITILTGSTTTGVSAISAGTFNINTGAKYIQQAGTTIPGTTKNFVAGSTYELQASGVATFSGSTYGNLILNYASGNTSAGGNLTTILNDLYVQNTGTGSFRLAAGTSPTVTISGNLRVDAGTLNFSTGAGAPNVTVNGDVLLNGGTFRPSTSTGLSTLFVKGNWVNNGATFTSGNSTVNFNSLTAPQNISGSSPNNFYNLTNGNTDFSGLSLDANITVTNVLSFDAPSNGIFSTGSNTVFVTNPSPAAVAHPGQGFVVGNLKRSIAGAGGVFDFPVGSFLGYTPAVLTFNNGNTAGDVNVTTTDGVSFDYPYAFLSATAQLARTWTITNGGVGTFNADAVFTFLPDDLLNGASATLLKGYKFDAPSTYSFSANTSVAPNSFSFNGITSFSEFGAGECIGGLSVGGTVTNVTCNSGSDGAISTIVSGNVTPVTYLWNTVPPQTTANISGLTAGNYSVTVTEETTCSASNSFEITEPPAVPAPVSGGDQTVCSDGSPTQTLTATATSDETIVWYDAAANGNVVGTPTQVGVGTVTYYAEAFDGTCSSLTRTAVTLTINPVPAPPVSGGDQTACENGSPTQTLTATATGVSITWYDAPTGGNTVSTPELVGVGTVTYYAESSNGLCVSLTRTAVTLTILAAPAAPVASNQTVCSNGSPTQTLTATATGGTITWYDAATNGNVVPSPVQVGVGSSTYYAEAFDGSCNSLTRTPVTLTINIPPATPGPISGFTNACPYIGTGEPITYSIDPVPYAESYQWTLPNTVTYVSGQGTTSITFTVNNTFDDNPNPTTRLIRVKGLSACGNSADRLLYILAQFPSTPGTITGPTDICALIGTGNTATYTINKVVAATSYAWTTPAGFASVVHPNPPGVNDTSIVVTFASNYATGAVTVSAVNGCGTSGSVRSLVVPRTPSSRPGLISGPTNVCANILPTGTAATYTIIAVPGATSYTWTAPSGSVVTHPNGAGVNDTTITIQFPVGFSVGSISVSSTNGCGTSAVRSLSMTKLNPATPSIIDVIQTGFCEDPGGRVYTYTLASMPANASTVQWNVPIPQGAILVSGQGSSSITVSYPATAVEGVVTAQSFNGCGSSTIRSTSVKLPACPPPAFTKIAGRQVTDNVTTGGMQLNIFPNPAVADFKVQVISAGAERIQVRITDMQGRVQKTITVKPNQTIDLGSSLKGGSYLVEAIQGTNRVTGKLIKF